MPYVPKEWLDAVVYLYRSEQDAKQGERSGGTGFIVSVSCEDAALASASMAHMYAVTNSHVIREGGAPVIRINLRDGGFDVLTLDAGDWVHHPDGDDIAVAAIKVAAATHRYSCVLRSMILTPEIQREYELGPGDEAFFIGRYVDHEGTTHNVPTVRFGHVSVLPAEAVRHATRGVFQDTILVEARSLSGYSGSPVFVTPSAYVTQSPDPESDIPIVRAVTDAPCFLLGIDYGHHHWNEPVRDPSGDPVPDKTYVRLNSGMMLVVPAWKILDILDSEEFVSMRRNTEEEVMRQVVESPVALDTAGGESEFERFQDLTQKLVHVPKKELDERRRAEESK